MTMGKIRRVIADFIRSRRVDDKRNPRFQSGYLAGLNDARLEAETTHEDGIIRLEKRPGEHVLWYHGEIVWRSRPQAAGTQCCMCGKKNLSTAEGDGGSECELSDGRWVCSAECWDQAVEPAHEKHVGPDAAARLERILRLGRSMKWTPHGAPALDDENTAVALGELFQIFFQDAVDRALATTGGSAA